MSRFTIVSLHAHPDDEALLTAGTLAAAAAAGHRVVLVVATSGEAGLSDRTAALGRRRDDELERSAEAIGAARVVRLGYADSGLDGRAASGRGFAHRDPDEVADRVAAVLAEERAEVLTTYDAAGGYGHPDHVQVHRAGRLAARRAGTPVVLEATVDRDVLLSAACLLRLASRFAPVPPVPDLRHAFTARSDLTHRIGVSPHLDAKIAALRAHHSQTTGGGDVRTLTLLLGLPAPVRRRVLGTEWFREVGRVPGRRPADDVFASLRGVRAPAAAQPGGRRSHG